MKGRILTLVCLLSMLNTAFAVGAVPAGSVSHAAAQAESKQIASANAPNAPVPQPLPPGSVGAGSGYFKAVGSFGTAQMNVGKSSLRVSTAESDWVSQTSTNWQTPVLRLGLGYVYAISDAQKGYAEQLVWLPSIEPRLSVYYFNMSAKGNVYRFNSLPASSTFTLPVRSTTLMLDAVITLAAYHKLSFFVLGGMGASWNSIKYSDSPNANAVSPRPPLNLNTSTRAQGSYEWGAGMTYAFNQRVALGLEYLYTHMGNISASGSGTLGGVPDLNIGPPGFSLRTQAILLDMHVALS